MPIIRCPKCDQKLRYPDHPNGRAFRCAACNHKISLNESEAADTRTKSSPVKSKARSSKLEIQMRRHWLPLLCSAIVTPIGLFLIFAALVSPVFALLGMLFAQALFLFAFVVGCVLAYQDGSIVPFDYLEGLGPLRWLFAVGFFGFYLLGYMGLWFIAQIHWAMQRPLKMTPWLGMQAFSVIVLIGSMTCGSLSNRQQMQTNAALRQGAPVNLPGQAPPNGPVVNDPPKGQPNQPAQGAPPEVVTGDPTLDKLLADLASKEPFGPMNAANQLAKMQPNEHRAVVAEKLGEHLKTADIFKQEAVIKALGVWGTRAQVPLLIAVLEDPSPFGKGVTLSVLGRFHDERAVAPVVRSFQDFMTRDPAGKALLEMGPMAEKDLIPLLKSDDRGLRYETIKVLKVVGTDKCVPVLQELALRDKGSQPLVTDALTAIASRVKP
jgi:hypothetical protein